MAPRKEKREKKGQRQNPKETWRKYKDSKKKLEMQMNVSEGKPVYKDHRGPSNVVVAVDR